MVGSISQEVKHKNKLGGTIVNLDKDNVNYDDSLDFDDEMSFDSDDDTDLSSNTNSENPVQQNNQQYQDNDSYDSEVDDDDAVEVSSEAEVDDESTDVSENTGDPILITLIDKTVPGLLEYMRDRGLNTSVVTSDPDYIADIMMA